MASLVDGVHALLETDLASSGSSNIFSSAFFASDPLIIEVCGSSCIA